jgi:hypothetical protein
VHEVSVDGVRGHRASKVAHGPLQHEALVGEGLYAEAPDDRLVTQGEQARRPAPVAPRRPVAAYRFLQYGDAQLRVTALELAGRPEAGEATADDRDVHVEMAVQ